MDIQLADQHMIHTYNRSITFVKGEDVHLIDDEGKKYLDMGAGIAVSSLGYSNEDLKNAIKNQVDLLMHTSNLYFNEPAVKASQLICKASGMDRVFFTNSGTEAIEGALKIARRYAYDKNPNSKGEIIAMNHSFHGRSMGALSVTGTKHYRDPFEPLIGGVSFAEFNNLESVKALITEDTCGIIMETLQGEGGIYPATEEFIKGVRALCDEHDIVLIFDEIQCGMGRTGKMYTYQHYGVEPDVMTTAKALGCGVPVGAFAAKEKYANALVPGDHGTTYGGNPLATAAICEVYAQYEKLGVLDHVNEIAPYMVEKLNALAPKCADKIKEVTGLGLMQGIELTGITPAQVVKSCLEKGLILISAGTNIVRFVPPLVIEKEHVDEMCDILDQVFAELA